MILFHWSQKLYIVYRLLINLCLTFKLSKINIYNTLELMIIVGPGSLTICLITAFFIGMIFTLQIAKEFIYLNAMNLIGAVLTITFIRELSPVLTSIIVIGRIGSSFTAELATMRVTDQIDALYLLNTNPLFYLIFPRMIACMFMTPLLNFISFATSLASSSFICFILYNIDPVVFFTSSFSSLSVIDLLKSFFKTLIFGLIISIISCSWGLSANGGAKGVGKSTTSSVVVCLLFMFIADFILSYLMFSGLESSIKVL